MHLIVKDVEVCCILKEMISLHICIRLFIVHTIEMQEHELFIFSKFQQFLITIDIWQVYIVRINAIHFFQLNFSI